MIYTKEIHKKYKSSSSTIEVLKNINFSISAGSWVTIVGPSGSGKSTFLNIISGLLPPDYGEVQFDDFNLYKLKEQERSKLRRKRMGFVFQDFKLLPYYSVLDNVMLPMYYDQEKKTLKENAKSLLNMVGINETIFSRLPEGLSGGEKQRVAIARALIANPDVLFCDEPTGNLDSENRDNIIEIFTDLREQGKNIIMVTHDVEIADRGDKVYQLINGSLTPFEVSV